MDVTRRSALMGTATAAAAVTAFADTAEARATPNHVWGAAAADAEIPHDAVPYGHVLHNDQHYPVNAHWHEANTARWPHLAARSHQELYDLQMTLIRKSNNILTRLNRDEFAYLRAANNHFNVRTSLNLAQGRHHSEFGYTGVDQLHFVGDLQLCGCHLAFVKDHHKAVAGEAHISFPHIPVNLCRHHVDHARDLARLHEHVYADNGEPEFIALLEEERKAESLGLPLPPKWTPKSRRA